MLKMQTINEEREPMLESALQKEKIELEFKVSVLEDKIKEASRIHEEERKCLQCEMKAETDKHNQILNQLRDKIECPVCMEVPRSGPVPVCSNGHFVCKKCKTGFCPTCRVAMENGKSLLASIVIENIKHVCKFVNCEDTFTVDKLDTHEKMCQHRTVLCPYNDCEGEMGLSKLLDHLVRNPRKD